MYVVHVIFRQTLCLSKQYFSWHLTLYISRVIKKVYLPYNFFSPLQRQVSVIVIVGYLDQPMDNKNWTKHRKQCTQYLIESPVSILAGPTPSDLNEIFTQVCLQILIYR